VQTCRCFTKEKLSGNVITIFYDYDDMLDDHKMLSLTQEMRPSESIFVSV